MATWNVDSVTKIIADSGRSHGPTKDIPYGKQIKLTDGVIVNVFDTGKLSVQGKPGPDLDAVRLIFGLVDGSAAVPSVAPVEIKPQKVFIVYGHDLECRKQLELLLLRLRLSPVILSNLVPSGLTIIEALEQHSEVPFAFVLLTGDDEGHPIGKPEQISPRARQNVILELGMFLQKLGRSRVGILHKGSIELPSDINGLIYIPFNADITEQKTRIAAVLQQAGFDINIADLAAD